MPVELNYFNPGYKILPGMFCEVYWPTRRHESTLFVPVTAVVSSLIDTYVCKINNGIIETVPVKKGQTMGGMVEVFGELHEGDLVAKKASEELQNGASVKPIVLTSKADIESEDPKREPYHVNAD
jgi:multidrug efflux pump subunit AcrA (membrane-fusion protein)